MRASVKRETGTGGTMSEKLQAAVKDSIAAARRSGLNSKGDIASYVARDPSVRAIARQSDGQLDMAALAWVLKHEWAFDAIWDVSPPGLSLSFAQSKRPP
jgi:hypothetical protein